MKKKNKILVTGGSGRFGKILKKQNFKDYFFPDKKELDITSIKSIKKFILKKRPKIIIHLAGLSRPVQLHESNLIESINLNIIGTSNLVMVCKKYNIKFVYFSTNYVYPGTKGNYKETDPVLPFNNYGWSKLGGESAVHMYKNSLILRICMTQKPFIHKKALSDVYFNFIFQEEIAKKIPELIRLKGILNVGGPISTIYSFAKKHNSNVKKISLKKIKTIVFKKNMSMNVKKFNKIYKKKI